MSFANQALSAEYIVAERGHARAKVYDVPEEIDKEIARLKLETMGIEIDHADRGAGEVPGLLGRRHITREGQSLERDSPRSRDSPPERDSPRAIGTVPPGRRA